MEFFWLGIAFIWLPIAVALGLWNQERGNGFIGAFFPSIILGPFWAVVIILGTERKTPSK